MKRIALFLITLIAFSGISEAQAAQQPEKPEVFVQLGHAGGVKSIVFSPDGKYALSGGGKTLKLWNAATGREIRTFKGHSNFVSSVAFSPDGKYALSGSWDSTMKLWDIATGREIHTFKGHSQWVNSVAFSPDGRYALSGSNDNTLKLWDVATGREIRTFKGHSGEVGMVTSVAFSPNGRYALSGNWNKTVKLWNIATGREIRTFKGHSDEVDSVVFSPDGKYALSGGGDTLTLWKIATGREIRSISGPSMSIQHVTFSPDGKYALLGDGDALTLWDIATGKKMRSFEGHSDQVNAVAFSPDGRYALSGSNDRSVKLWDVATGQEVRTFGGHPSWVGSVAFSPDGKYALSGGGDLNLWDTATGRKVRAFKGHSNFVSSVAFSPDGKYALSGSWDSTMKLWDIATGKEIRTFKGHSDEVTSVAFSPDGKYALSGSKDYTIKLWAIATGKEIRTFKGHSLDVTSVAFSPDGKYALSGSVDGFVKLWDIATGKEIRGLENHSEYVTSVAFSPNGKYALSGGGSIDPEATGTKGGISLDGVAAGVEVRSFERHSGGVGSVVFSPDGKYALSGSDDNTLRLWDIATGREIRVFKGHASRVSSVAFSPDGKRIISSSTDLRVWDVATGKELVKMIAFKDGEWLSMTPEGFFAASSPKAAQNLNVRVGKQVYGIDQFYEQFYRPDLVALALNGKGQKEIQVAAAKADFNKIAASGAPPVVSFVSPSAGLSSQRDIEVVASLEEQDGGIGKVEWKLNGMTVGVAEPGRGIAIKAKAGASVPAKGIKLSRTLTLAPGDNTVEIVAYSKAGIASNPVALRLNLKDAISEKPALYILAIGINKYRDKSLWLNYAVPDAQALTGSMKGAGSSIFTGVHVTGVYDQNATFDGIKAAFDKVAKSAKSNDVFILYLAGHGITLDGRYHFLPADFRYYNEDSIRKASIDQDHLQRWMAEIPAMKNLVLLDTCNSGSFVEAQAVTRGLAEKTAIDKLVRATGRAVISASTDSQVALEGFKGHGIFTYALLQAMKQADAKSGNRDGVTSTGEIANFVQEYVPDVTYKKWGYEQVPQVNLHGRSFPVAVVQ